MADLPNIEELLALGDHPFEELFPLIRWCETCRCSFKPGERRCLHLIDADSSFNYPD